MNYTVYLITLDDIVVYVGKTNDFKRRCREHKYKGSKNSAIPNDIDLNRVKFISIKEFPNKEDALKYEDELILKYNLKSDNGWNKIRSGLISIDRHNYQKIQSKTDKYKEYMKEWQRVYRKTDKYKEKFKEWKEKKYIYDRELKKSNFVFLNEEK